MVFSTLSELFKALYTTCLIHTYTLFLWKCFLPNIHMHSYFDWGIEEQLGWIFGKEQMGIKPNLPIRRWPALLPELHPTSFPPLPKHTWVNRPLVPDDLVKKPLLKVIAKDCSLLDCWAAQLVETLALVALCVLRCTWQLWFQLGVFCAQILGDPSLVW